MTARRDATTLRGPRFVVIETEGWIIGASRERPSPHPTLSCSVLDTAYCHREVARFNQENVRPRSMMRGFKRQAIRARAHGLAAILNADHA